MWIVLVWKISLSFKRSLDLESMLKHSSQDRSFSHWVWKLAALGKMTQCECSNSQLTLNKNEASNLMLSVSWSINIGVNTEKFKLVEWYKFMKFVIFLLFSMLFWYMLWVMSNLYEMYYQPLGTKYLQILQDKEHVSLQKELMLQLPITSGQGGKCGQVRAWFRKLVATMRKGGC